jgi:hypothetical protein
MQKLFVLIFLMYFVTCQPSFGDFNNVIPKNCCFLNNCPKPMFCNKSICRCQHFIKNCCQDPSICKLGTFCTKKCRCERPSCCNGMIMCKKTHTCRKCQCVPKFTFPPCFPKSCIPPLIWNPKLCECVWGPKPITGLP